MDVKLLSDKLIYKGVVYNDNAVYTCEYDNLIDCIIAIKRNNYYLDFTNSTVNLNIVYNGFTLCTADITAITEYGCLNKLYITYTNSEGKLRSAYKGTIEDTLNAFISQLRYVKANGPETIVKLYNYEKNPELYNINNTIFSTLSHISYGPKKTDMYFTLDMNAINAMINSLYPGELEYGFRFKYKNVDEYINVKRPEFLTDDIFDDTYENYKTRVMNELLENLDIYCKDNVLLVNELYDEAQLVIYEDGKPLYTLDLIEILGTDKELTNLSFSANTDYYTNSLEQVIHYIKCSNDICNDLLAFADNKYIGILSKIR